MDDASVASSVGPHAGCVPSRCAASHARGRPSRCLRGEGVGRLHGVGRRGRCPRRTRWSPRATPRRRRTGDGVGERRRLRLAGEEHRHDARGGEHGPAGGHDLGRVGSHGRVSGRGVGVGPASASSAETPPSSPVESSGDEPRAPTVQASTAIARPAITARHFAGAREGMRSPWPTARWRYGPAPPVSPARMTRGKRRWR